MDLNLILYKLVSSFFTFDPWMFYGPIHNI